MSHARVSNQGSVSISRTLLRFLFWVLRELLDTTIQSDTIPGSETAQRWFVGVA